MVQMNILLHQQLGSRAGNVGIGSTLPDQKLDIGGSIHIDEQIFDSDNTSGNQETI